MGLPVTLFRSSDAGAPFPNPTKPSEWIAIFKACLVDGYGSKPSLGWTLEFEDAANFKAVFKNSLTDGGSGGAIQVQSHDGTDSGWTRITAAKEITALDTLVEAGGYRGLSANGSYNNGWTLVGCGRSFYVRQETNLAAWNNTGTSYYNTSIALWIGDIQSDVPNDQHIFTIVSNGWNRSAMDNSLKTGYRSCGLYNYDSAGQYGYKAALDAVDGSGTAADYMSPWKVLNTSPNSYTASPSSLGVPIDFTAATLTHSNFSNQLLPASRGSIPGLFVTSFLGFYGRNIPIVETVGGVDFEIQYDYYTTGVAVQISGEWDYV